MASFMKIDRARVAALEAQAAADPDNIGDPGHDYPKLLFEDADLEEMIDEEVACAWCC